MWLTPSKWNIMRSKILVLNIEKWHGAWRMEHGVLPAPSSLLHALPKIKAFIPIIILLFLGQTATAQDTVQVSLKEFIRAGLESSSKVAMNRQDVFLARNKIRQVQDKRYLPTFTLQTSHGLVPNAEAEDITPQGGAFFDDLSNLALYTQAKIQLVQPVFTWGALRNAVKASRAAAEAALNKFKITKNKTALRLYKHYQSYLLTLEVSRLLEEAQNKLDEVIAEFEEARTKEGSELDESDFWQLKVFKKEFAIRAGEVAATANYIQRVWNYVLGDEVADVVYMPDTYFLDPVENPIKTLSFYKNRAVNLRPEVLALESGIDAAGHALEATKSKNYPALFLGITATYIHTPNPPLGSYAFRLNENNFATAAVGVGFRQNLDFWSMEFDVVRSKIQLRQVKYSKQAAIEGIVLQVMEKYKAASVSQIKVNKLQEALITAKRWLRQEQLDYDLGLGNTKDLIDALKKEAMLRVRYKQAIFDFNAAMAELYRVSAIPVTQLTTNYQ